jgi:hypothetical protein
MFSVKSILFIIAVITASFFLCAWKQQAPSPDSGLEKIYGKWDWIETAGGIAGIRYSASTAKYTEMIEFDKDGTYKQYRNGNLKAEHSFTLTVDSSVPSVPKTYTLNLSQLVTFKGYDTLLIEDLCADCFTSIYVRQK